MERNGAQGLPRRLLRLLMFQTGSDKPFRQFVTARRMDCQCDCWITHLYPDRVVLAIAEERQRLVISNERANHRIRMLETKVLEEQERTDILCE